MICIFNTLCDKYVSYCKLFIENQIYNMDTLKSIYHIEKPYIKYYNEISYGYGKITKLIINIFWNIVNKCPHTFIDLK